MRNDRLLVRLDAGTRWVLEQLAERQGTSLSDAVRLAIREVGWRRGLSDDERDLFTQRARQALQFAADEMTDRRAGSIEPVHLLLGLLRVVDGRAALMLGSLGIAVDDIYSGVDKAEGAQTVTPIGEGGLSESSKRVIERAVESARRLDHHHVGTEHLLLGLIDERSENPISALLSELGVDAARVRATVALLKERLARL